MNEFFSVDRIEGNYAIIETPDKEFITASISELPNNVIEGSVLFKKPDGTFQIDEKEEENRKKTNYNIQNSIFKEKI